MGLKLGYSDSYISQIENGRTAPPRGEVLVKFLRIYGGLSVKYFGELVREWKHEKSDLEILQELLPKLKSKDLKLIKLMAEQLANGIDE